jgi:hypothetical protein
LDRLETNHVGSETAPGVSAQHEGKKLKSLRVSHHFLGSTTLLQTAMNVTRAPVHGC